MSRIRRRVCSADLLIGVPVSQYTEVGPDTNEVQLPSSESAVFEATPMPPRHRYLTPTWISFEAETMIPGESSLVYPQVQVLSSWLTYAE